MSLLFRIVTVFNNLYRLALPSQFIGFWLSLGSSIGLVALDPKIFA